VLIIMPAVVQVVSLPQSLNAELALNPSLEKKPSLPFLRRKRDRAISNATGMTSDTSHDSASSEDEGPDPAKPAMDEVVPQSDRSMATQDLSSAFSTCDLNDSPQLPQLATAAEEPEEDVRADTSEATSIPEPPLASSMDDASSLGNTGELSQLENLSLQPQLDAQTSDDDDDEMLMLARLEADQDNQSNEHTWPEEGVARPPRRNSILKPRTEEIPIRNHRFSWKQLPKPSPSVLAACSATPETQDDSRTSTKVTVTTDSTAIPITIVGTRQRRRAVSFNSVMIRNFDQTVGDNPSVSYGPPISLDWMYTQSKPIDLNAYEKNRGPRRNARQMMLSYYNRRNILAWRFGATEEELKEAEIQANRIKRARALTKALVPTEKLQELVESASRKTKRRFGGERVRRSTSV
jgi:hypothetical protein